jgi:hypothetical protein
MPNAEGASLPAQFTELEKYVPEWDLPGTNERYAKRLASRIGDLEIFFESMMARVEDIKAYLDAKPFADYTQPDRRLARLMFAVGVVGPAVEMFRQPAVPNTDSSSFRVMREQEL